MNYQMHVQGAFIVIYNNNAASPVRSTSYFYGYFQFTKNKVVAFLFTYIKIYLIIFLRFFFEIRVFQGLLLLFRKWFCQYEIVRFTTLFLTSSAKVQPNFFCGTRPCVAQTMQANIFIGQPVSWTTKCTCKVHSLSSIIITQHHKDLLNNIFKVFFRNTEWSRVYYYCFENGFASTK